MRPLYPRHHVDIAPRELVRALRRCASPVGAEGALARLEAYADPRGEILATLSVRSGFDALLRALAFAPGREVLLSGFTIPDMARIVRAHGLVPVPLDCEFDTLAPTVATVERALTPRSCALVVAQLFGARVDMAPLRELARRAGVLFVDDDAQGYTGLARLAGTPGADVVLHSFGSIKSGTALGGGLMRVRDPSLRARVRAVLAGWPLQETAAYARKIATQLALGRVVSPPRYAAFERALAAAGRDLDPVVTGLMRGFPRDQVPWLRALRRRPCAALAATLLARLQGSADVSARVEARRASGERLLARIAQHAPVLGGAMPDRTHWLFAVAVPEADALVRELRREGFDAARGTSTIAAVATAPERPEVRAAQCASWERSMVFLPAYPELPERERDRMADVVARASRSG